MSTAKIQVPAIKSYDILGELGRGGMAVVHHARHVGLGRDVALKMIHPELATESDLLMRLRRETSAMCGLSHPSLVKMLDAGVQDGQPFIAMELIHGTTLSTSLRSEPHAIRARAEDIFAQIVDAVAYLHDRGFVHRDLKPSNIMVEATGRVVVMDLGLIKNVRQESVAITRDNTAVGTPPYMSPESLRGAPASPAADVWALGCLYYELFAAVPLFGSASFEKMVANVFKRRLPDLEPVFPEATMSAERRFLDALLTLSVDDRPKNGGQALRLYRRMKNPGRPSGGVRGTPGRPSGMTRRPSLSIAVPKNTSPRRGPAAAALLAVMFAWLLLGGGFQPGRIVTGSVPSRAAGESPADRYRAALERWLGGTELELPARPAGLAPLPAEAAQRCVTAVWSVHDCDATPSKAAQEKAIDAALLLVMDDETDQGNWACLSEAYKQAGYTVRVNRVSPVLHARTPGRRATDARVHTLLVSALTAAPDRALVER